MEDLNENVYGKRQHGVEDVGQPTGHVTKSVSHDSVFGLGALKLLPGRHAFRIFCFLIETTEQAFRVWRRALRLP